MKSLFSLNSAICVLLCLIGLRYAVWYTDNPDSIQYIVISSHYLHGDFPAALNGYWSPLISWLLIPFQLIFSDGIIAFKILQIVIAVLTVLLWEKLVQQILPQIRLKKLFAFFGVIFVVPAAILNLTPDLLFVLVLFALLNHFIQMFGDGDRLLALTNRELIITGLLGGLLYLTKAFGLPLFLIVFSFVVFRKKRFFNLKRVFVVMGIFILISGSWIAAISSKYNHFTISEAARFNMTKEVAPLSGQMVELPGLGVGLSDPPISEQSVSSWENPGANFQLTSLSPVSDSNYYYGLIKRNLLSIYYTDFRRQIGIVFLLLLIFFFVQRKKGQSEISFAHGLVLSVVLFTYLGYSLILVHERYTWSCMLLMFLMSAFFLTQLDKKVFPSNMILALSLVFFLFSAKRPVKQMLFSNDTERSFDLLWKAVRSPLEMMEATYGIDNDLKTSLDQLKSKIPAGSKMASIKYSGPYRDSFSSAQFIAYELHAKYYGQVLAADDSVLKEKKIQYLLTLSPYQPSTDSSKIVGEVGRGGALFQLAD